MDCYSVAVPKNSIKRSETTNPFRLVILEWMIPSMLGKDRCPVEVAPGSGHHVSIPLPAGYEGAFVARFVAERD